MPFLPDLSSPTSRRVTFGLGALAAASACLTFWESEDAWLAAGLLLLTAGLGLTVFVLILIGRLQSQRPLLALRDSTVLGVVVVLAAWAGHLLRQSDLQQTRERVEMLAAAITKHQRAHGSLPESLAVVEASLPRPAHPLHAITYKPGSGGNFTLFFQQSWYRHEYSPVTHSWVVSD